MANKKLEKDERALAVEKASYFLAFRVIAFAILCDVIYRSFMLNEAPWDLLGIVIIGGLVSLIYQVRYKTWTRSWVKITVLAFAIALLIAAVFGVVRMLIK